MSNVGVKMEVIIMQWILYQEFSCYFFICAMVGRRYACAQMLNFYSLKDRQNPLEFLAIGHNHK